METHILFFILAAVLIAILVGYSVWSARREKSRIFSNTFSTRPPSTPIQSDMLSSVPHSLNPQGADPSAQTVSEKSAEFVPAQQQAEVEQTVRQIRISLPEAEQSQPAVEPNQAVLRPFVETINSIEPERTIQIQINESSPEVTSVEEKPSSDAAAQQMVTLYVVAPEHQLFRGDVVVQNLEALGFQFGEYQIFHRHIDNATSPILFSVANMIQPGVFDLAKMDQFTTVGLVFFMQLPSVGNDLVNLRLMIRTVESFAQAIGGFVLDEQHELFDDESRQQYLRRVTQ